MLFAAASEGRAAQWDGAATPHGLLLRWLLPADQAFPPHGFDLFWAPPSISNFKLNEPSFNGKTSFDLDTNTELFSGRPLNAGANGITIGTGDELTLMFDKPVSVLRLASAHSNGNLNVKLMVGGRLYDERPLHPSHQLEWGTRGASGVVITGNGVLAEFTAALSEGPYEWKKITHLCLPLTHPAYPCSSGTDDFNLARSRLPAGADWSGKYKDVFTGLHGLLKNIFDGSTAPFPAAAPGEGPSLQMDRQAALFLALLDPNVARMLGFAYDHDAPDFPVSSYFAYKVEAIRSTRPGRGSVRQAIHPAVYFRETEPFGPDRLEVAIDAPGGRTRAGLRWAPVPLAGRTGEPPTLRYQVLSRALGPISGPAPAVPDLGQQDIVGDDTPILLTGQALQEQPRVPFVYQSDLASSYRAFGVRGVDLFGRVSEPATVVRQVDDSVWPPPPRILDAQYWQQGMSVAPAGAGAWMARNPGSNAFELCWEWPPELANRAPDVDTFEVLVRTPITPSGAGPHEAQIDWGSAQWNAPRFTLHPAATRLTGAVGDPQPGIPALQVLAVDTLGSGTFRLHTDLNLEWGKAALARCELHPAAGGGHYAVLAHGAGPQVSMVVSAAAGNTPAAGQFALTDPENRVASMSLALHDPAAVDRHHQAGAIVFDGGGQFQCLGFNSGNRIGLLQPDAPGGNSRMPASGEAATWFPGYRVVFEDDGFGPKPGPGTPLAQAQLTVRSLRPPSPVSGPRISAPAQPHTVSAVDHTPPARPELPDLPSGPHCAQLASAADYHGISRFTLNWPGHSGERYIIYRVLRDALLAEDRRAQAAGLPTHQFSAAQLPNDAQERALVTQQLTALDAALTGGDQGLITQAYAALGARAVQLIASRDEFQPAFSSLCKRPLEASELPFEDGFDGRARGAWIYRVSAVSLAGVEGEWSKATPPICAPDVTAPPPPRFQEVLAAEEQVVLRWLKSPADDLAHYRLYRSTNPAVDNPRDMDELDVLLPAPDSTAVPGATAPLAVDDQPAWLEYRDTLPGGITARYALVAEDHSGNRSHPSQLAVGRALASQPVVPVWDEPARNGDLVELRWTHPNPRLSCLVERRFLPDGIWLALGNWLPRSVYALVDVNSFENTPCEYRLRVRSISGLVAAERPTVILPPRVN